MSCDAVAVVVVAVVDCDEIITSPEPVRFVGKFVGCVVVWNLVNFVGKVDGWSSSLMGVAKPSVESGSIVGAGGGGGLGVFAS